MGSVRFSLFCDRVQQQPGTDQEQVAMEIQRAEWQLLFDYCARPPSELRLLILVTVLAILGVAAWQIDKWKKQPSEVSFAHVARETITSSVPTNGKVEPVESAIAHAERSGAWRRS